MVNDSKRGRHLLPLALGALATIFFACAAPHSDDPPGNTGSSETGGTGESGGASTGLGDAGLSACDHYFAATYTRCGGAVVPASELARIRGRFEQVCANEAALPGSGMNAASIEACATALDSSPCELPAGPPLECDFHGSLSGGVACTDGIQCQSGGCKGTVSTTPEGASPVTCGTCEPVVANGQSCNSAGCAAGAVCMTTDPSAPVANYTCTPITQGAVGAACDDDETSCKTGLYCSVQTAQCAPLAEAGAACGDYPSWPGGCAPPLSCVGIAGAASDTCGLGSTGAYCLLDGDCTAGLGCIPGPCSSTGARIGCSESGTCGAISWGAPGATCDGYTSRCLVGSCNFGSLFGPPANASGTCPSVITDGQPCTVTDPSATCDTFSECFQGSCALLDEVVCK